MPKMFYCSMHKTIWWEGLNMLTDGCSVHMPIMFVNFKLWGAK